MKEKEVFIIGAKGIPARYGGFESFVEQLTLGKKVRIFITMLRVGVIYQKIKAIFMNITVQHALTLMYPMWERQKQFCMM